MKFFHHSALYSREQYRQAADIYEDTHDVPTAAEESGISLRQVYRFLKLNRIRIAPHFDTERHAHWKRAADLRTIYKMEHVAACLGVTKRTAHRYLAHHRKINPTHPAFQ